ncbi:MAG: hypothetical protein M3220_17480 [Chloroflexota bacterium]|nr:hypothetical protein [Chloroflexota bacterium]
MKHVTYGLTPTTYRRTYDWQASLEIAVDQQSRRIPKEVFGNFLEHLGFAIYGGVWSQLLANPVLEGDPHLTAPQLQALRTTGDYLTILFLYGVDRGILHAHKVRGIGPTGFGAAILDDAAEDGIPLGWVPLGRFGSVTPDVGYGGGAVRLHPTGADEAGQDVRLDAGPPGLRQGVFLPVHRIRLYVGEIWARRVSGGSAEGGIIEVGLRRRLSYQGAVAGKRLASAELQVNDAAWNRLPFQLTLEQGAVALGEPVDFYFRWHPRVPDEALLVDRALLFPADHVEGFDPEIIEVVRDMAVPLLRWPGGNFVSHYHWQDGIGPQEHRPTRPNPAWGGLEYNFVGTDEFIRFCELVGTEPHLVVNTGTGTADEAAAWVEYCNGSPDTPMGRLRAANGQAEPYNVRLWEVGNEAYGVWQGGHHGADENARRFRAFAEAMRAVDPTIELIATGNPFDFVDPDAYGYMHVHNDRRWHRILLQEADGAADYISLHSLPANDYLIEHLSDVEAYYSLMAQPDVWERKFLPDLLRIADEMVLEADSGEPVRLAITEWGILGQDRRRPNVANYGAVIYAGAFLNMMIRNADRIPIANATALLHGGCIHKIGGLVYVDPQVLVLQEYVALIGGHPLPVTLEGPGYDVREGPDLGAPIENVPYVDAIATLLPERQEVMVVAVNRHLSREVPLAIAVPGARLVDEAGLAFLAHQDVAAVASPLYPDAFRVERAMIRTGQETVSVLLPPLSLNWLRLPLQG